MTNQQALKPVIGLPIDLEKLFLELHQKFNDFKLEQKIGEKISPVDSAYLELIQRANDIYIGYLMMEQPDKLDTIEKMDRKTFYKDCLIPGVAALKHSIEQSKNLDQHIDIEKINGVSETLNRILTKFNAMYANDHNLQYSQICALEAKMKKIIELLQKQINENRNIHR
jgi:ASC-1-like (ASCH) protein